MCNLTVTRKRITKVHHHRGGQDRWGIRKDGLKEPCNYTRSCRTASHHVLLLIICQDKDDICAFNKACWLWLAILQALADPKFPWEQLSPSRCHWRCFVLPARVLPAHLVDEALPSTLLYLLYAVLTIQGWPMARTCMQHAQIRDRNCQLSCQGP